MLCDVITRFVVSANVNGRRGCTIESLKNLNFLQVCLIRNLGKLSDVGEAKRLQFNNRKNFFELGFNFGEDEAGERKSEEDEVLLEALQPPLNFKKLEIQEYRGNVFSSWLSSLNNLRRLELLSCRKCKQLPACFGKIGIP